MATRKKATTETKERASVSRERRLALALVALLDSEGDDDHADHIDPARATLKELGFGDLKSIPRQLAKLEAALATATADRNYAQVAKLGHELDRVKAGKVARVVEGGEG